MMKKSPHLMILLAIYVILAGIMVKNSLCLWAKLNTHQKSLLKGTIMLEPKFRDNDLVKRLGKRYLKLTIAFIWLKIFGGLFRKSQTNLPITLIVKSDIIMKLRLVKMLIVILAKCKFNIFKIIEYGILHLNYWIFF